VQRNERVYYVPGEVGRPGKFFMRDGQSVRAADALANASGLSPKGTLRRVYLARADKAGKTVVRQFNLDAYLKDGDQQNNPEILPGDCILFSQPKGLTFAAATQVLSAALLFENLVRN
jgi:protein involved in polysaccharide export with SLBB domain